MWKKCYWHWDVVTVRSTVTSIRRRKFSRRTAHTLLPDIRSLCKYSGWPHWPCRFKDFRGRRRTRISTVTALCVENVNKKHFARVCSGNCKCDGRGSSCVSCKGDRSPFAFHAQDTGVCRRTHILMTRSRVWKTNFECQHGNNVHNGLLVVLIPIGLRRCDIWGYKVSPSVSAFLCNFVSGTCPPTRNKHSLDVVDEICWSDSFFVICVHTTKKTIIFENAMAITKGVGEPRFLCIFRAMPVARNISFGLCSCIKIVETEHHNIEFKWIYACRGFCDPLDKNHFVG